MDRRVCRPKPMYEEQARQLGHINGANLLDSVHQIVYMCHNRIGVGKPVFKTNVHQLLDELGLLQPTTFIMSLAHHPICVRGGHTVGNILAFGQENVSRYVAQDHLIVAMPIAMTRVI